MRVPRLKIVSERCSKILPTRRKGRVCAVWFGQCYHGFDCDLSVTFSSNYVIYHNDFNDANILCFNKPHHFDVTTVWRRYHRGSVVLIMGAVLDDLAVVEHYDAIEFGDGAEPVGDDDARAVMHEGD